MVASSAAKLPDSVLEVAPDATKLVIVIPEGLRTSSITLDNMPYPIAARIESELGHWTVSKRSGQIVDEAGTGWSVAIGATEVVLTKR